MDPIDSNVEFSFVISCYFEEATVDEFLARVTTTMDQTGRSYEIIATNDGSTDRTFERLKANFEKHPRMACVQDLFRNSGQAAGITAGLAEARGKFLVFLDSDLQFSPEDLPKLIAEVDAGADFVTGVRPDRKDKFARRLPSLVANRILNLFCNKSVKDFGCTFKIVNGAIVRAFGFGPQKSLLMIDLINAAGRFVEVPVSHHERRVGKSGWSMMRLVDLLLDNILARTHRPFQYTAYLLMSLAGLVFLRVVFDWFLPARILPEVSNGLILNAMAIETLATLGLLSLVGEIVLRSLRKVHSNPTYIVKTRMARTWP